MYSLDDLEQDALREIFSIGIGRAGAVLGRMVNAEILLSLPLLRLVSRWDAAEFLAENANEWITVVRQPFSGPLHGAAFLVYPESSSLDLVRVLLHEEGDAAEMNELERESLVEVGNVILNACLGTMANLLTIELCCSVPEFVRCPRHAVFTHAVSPRGDVAHPLSGGETSMRDVVILVKVDFSIVETVAKGHVVLLFDGVFVVDHLRRYLDRLTGRLPS